MIPAVGKLGDATPNKRGRYPNGRGFKFPLEAEQVVREVAAASKAAKAAKACLWARGPRGLRASGPLAMHAA